VVLPPGDPWSAYARLVVEIDVTTSAAPAQLTEPAELTQPAVSSQPACELVVVRAAPVGQAGRWPFLSREPVHVLTAWNPGERRPGLDANRDAQARLERALQRLDARTSVARGRDPVTGERDEGVAVHGLAEETVRALGARFGQDAIYAWSPLEWAIVSCTGPRREVSGWALLDRAG